jgi:hypothetical protein
MHTPSLPPPTLPPSPAPQVCDFGLSRVKEDAALNQTDAERSGVGSPQWTAPEILRGGAYDEHADSYSFGILLYEVLARALPYQCEPSHLIIVGVITGMLERPRLTSEQAARWPAPLLGLMGGCMAEEPSNRPDIESVLDVLEDLAPKERAAASRHSGVPGNGAPAYAAAQTSRDGTPRGGAPSVHASPPLRPSRTPASPPLHPTASRPLHPTASPPMHPSRAPAADDWADFGRPPPLAHLGLGSPAGRSSRHVAMGDTTPSIPCDGSAIFSPDILFSPAGSGHGVLFCSSDPGKRRAVPPRDSTSPRALPGSPRTHPGDGTTRALAEAAGGTTRPNALPPPSRPLPVAATATAEDLEDAAFDRTVSLSQRNLSMSSRAVSISRPTPAATRARSVSRGGGTASRALSSVTTSLPATHAEWRVEDQDAMRYSHGDEDILGHDSIPGSPTSSADGDTSLAALAVSGLVRFFQSGAPLFPK